MNDENNRVDWVAYWQELDRRDKRMSKREERVRLIALVVVVMLLVIAAGIKW